jgi:hypothetical protein
MNKKERFFRVKYGYGKMDQVTISESELERAIYSQIKGTPMLLGTSMVKGNNIIAIQPNYHKHTGWNDWYEPKDADDWKQIKRDCPDYSGVVEKYKLRVQHLLQSGQDKLIGQNVAIPELDSPKRVLDSVLESTGGEMKSIQQIMSGK